MVRRRRTSLAVVLVLSGLGGCGRAKVEEHVLHVPYTGPGALVTLWSRGPVISRESDKRAIVITRKGKSTVIELELVGATQWFSPGELLVEQTVLDPQDPINGPQKIRLLVIGLDGEVRQVLDDGTGEWIQVRRARGKALLAGIRQNRITVWDLRSGEQRDLTPEKFPPGWAFKSPLSRPVWSSDECWLALPVLRRSAARPENYLWGIWMLRVDGKERRRIGGERQSEPGGMFPMFALEEGIYARSARGLLRCRPERGDCELVYKVFALSEGTGLPGGRALVLVRDTRRYGWDYRAKELHEVDLSTGEGRVLSRFADDWFVQDIDWIDDEASLGEGKPDGGAP